MNRNTIPHNHIKISQFEITRTKREPFFEMTRAHNHNAYEIYYLLSGNRRFFIEDTIYTITAGDFVIISKGLLHKTSYVVNDTHERYDMYIPNELMERAFERLGRETIGGCFRNPYLCVPLLKRDYVEQLLERLEKEYVSPDELSEKLIEGYISELMAFIIRESRERSAEEADINEENGGFSQKAAKYIFGNYNKNITLDDIAHYVNLSSSHFSKKFKEDTGFGFKEYLLNVRIKHAMDYLLNTKKTVAEIAAACGFSDSNYFGDVFKRMKGESPSSYRRNNLK